MKIKFYTKIQQALAVALAPMLLVGCMSLPGATMTRLSVKKHASFPIVQTKETGWGVVNHPFLAPISSNRVALTYFVAGDGVRAGRSPVAWPAYTDDKGETWSFGNPYQWNAEHEAPIMYAIDEGEPFSAFRLGLFFSYATLPNGERVAFSRNLFEPTGGFLCIRSTDGGLTWNPPESVVIDYPEALSKLRLLYVEGAAAVTDDGRLLVAGYGTEKAGAYSTYVFESLDGGRSFSYLSTVATPSDAPWDKGGPCEPALVALPDGELLVVMRTNSGGSSSGKGSAKAMLSARSRDGGRTWEREKMRLSGVMPKLRLLSNGIVALAFGRPGNNLAFSLDNGHTWGAVTTITPPDRATSGYLDFVEVEPGRLLVVHDLKNASLERFWLWEPTRINGLVALYVDVSRRF